MKLFSNQVAKRERNQVQGAVAVEFAIVAPIFFMVVLGIVEFGRMSMVQQIITNGAREGARIAVFDDTTTAQVETKVDSYLANCGITGNTVEVDPSPPSSAGYGESVTVTVVIPFDKVSWLPKPFFVKGTDLRASSVMRRETIE